MSIKESREEFLRKHFYTTIYRSPPIVNDNICVYCGIDHFHLCTSDVVIIKFIAELNNDDFLLVHQIFNEWCLMNNDQRLQAVHKYFTPNDPRYGFKYHSTSTSILMESVPLLPTQIIYFFVKFIVNDHLLTQEYYKWYKSENDIQRIINYLLELKSSNPFYRDRAYLGFIYDWELFDIFSKDIPYILTFKPPSKEGYDNAMKIVSKLSYDHKKKINFDLLFNFKEIQQYGIPDDILSDITANQIVYRVSKLHKITEAYLLDFPSKTRTHKIDECRDILFGLFFKFEYSSSVINTSLEANLEKFIDYFGSEVINYEVIQYIKSNHTVQTTYPLLVIRGIIMSRFKFDLDFNSISDILSDWILTNINITNMKERDIIEMLPLLQVTTDNVPAILKVLNLNLNPLFFWQYVPYILSSKIGDSVTKYFRIDNITNNIGNNLPLIFYHGILLNCSGASDNFKVIHPQLQIFSSIYSYSISQNCSLIFITLDLVLNIINRPLLICREKVFRGAIVEFFLELFSKLDDTHYKGVVNKLVENAEVVAKWVLEESNSIPRDMIQHIFNNYRLAQSLLSTESGPELEELLIDLSPTQSVLQHQQSFINMLKLVKYIYNPNDFILKALNAIGTIETSRELLYMVDFEYIDGYYFLARHFTYDKLEILFRNNSVDVPIGVQKVREFALKLTFLTSGDEDELPSDIPLEKVYSGMKIKDLQELDEVRSFFDTVPSTIWRQSKWFIMFYSQFTRFKEDVKTSKSTDIYWIDYEVNNYVNTLNPITVYPDNNKMNLLDLPVILLERIVTLLYRIKTYHHQHKINLSMVSKKMFDVCSSILTNNYNDFDSINRNYIGVPQPYKLNINARYCLFKDYPKFLRYLSLNLYPIENQERIFYERAESMSVEYDINNSVVSNVHTRIIPTRNTNFKSISFYTSSDTNIDQVVTLCQKSPLLEHIYFVVTDRWDHAQVVFECILKLQLPNLKTVNIYQIFDENYINYGFNDDMEVNTISLDLQSFFKDSILSNSTYTHPIRIPKLKILNIEQNLRFSGFDRYTIHFHKEELDKEGVMSFYSNTFSKTDVLSFKVSRPNNVPILVDIATQFPNIKKLKINITKYYDEMDHLSIESLQLIFQKLNHSNIKTFTIFHRVYDFNIPLCKYSLFDDGYLSSEHLYQFYFSKIKMGAFKPANHLNMKFIK
ncbi:hypothetical protein DLAC_03276 [Tieghemostelium lacteum]|uniref:Uncharacterized protein n=1 Tax=Tieghemostelium lacteum TaxID=361077 RepID=A0A152A1N9_TIELA|nr:hypothetical protein DLAC_03276 [Tieghemostelium lacteum]|eukprot:KYR00124.1 hypothetical protein DLAC_03276 [Tieghemostelium lacteum]